MEGTHAMGGGGGGGGHFKLVLGPRFGRHFLFRSLKLGLAVVVVTAKLARVFIKLGALSFDAINLRLFCS